MRRLAHFVLPLLVFAAGCGAGAWFSRSRGAADFSLRADPRLVENADASPASAAKNARAFPSDEEMLTAIMSAVAEEEPLLRAHRLHDLLGRLGAAELATLFDRTVRIEDRDRRDGLLGPLLARWAALDPAGAAAAVRPYRDRFRATARGDRRSVDAAVNTAWAQAQPEATLAEAMATPDAPWARDTARAALQSLAERHPARQLEALARWPASRLRDGLCETAINSLAEKDSAAAEASLALLSEPRDRARLRAEILSQLAERDPAAALARFTALAPDLTPGTSDNLLISRVLSAAAKEDPAAALAAAEALPEELRTTGFGAALVGWAAAHPVDALSWAAAHGIDVAEAKATMQFFPNFSGFAYEPLMSAALRSDRAKTLAWMRTQPASPERDAMFRAGVGNGTVEQQMELYAELTPRARTDAAGQVFDSLNRDDPQRAEAWVKAQPSGPARQAAISSLASKQAGNAPENRDALAEAWSAGADRDAVLRGLVWNANNDTQRGLDFARRVSDPAMRETLLEWVARSWFRTDEPAARAWVTTAPELSAEQKRVLLREHDLR